MIEKNIQRLEDEIKNLHYNPIQEKHSFSDKPANSMLTDFWDNHISFVVEKSKKLAKKYDADENVAWASAILHDIARIEDMEPHDEIGAKKSFDILIDKGFDMDFSSRVKDAVLTHRCKKYPPENLEQKIIATADATSHFMTPFYLWIAKDSKQNMDEMLAKNLAKIERDYKEKIFFEDERNEVKPFYEILKRWCEYKKIAHD